MWRLGYYRGITWRMLLSFGGKITPLNGADHVTWQWTDFFLADDYNPEEYNEAVREKVPHGYIWAIIKDPAHGVKPSILGTLLKKGRREYKSGPFDLEGL